MTKQIPRRNKRPGLTPGIRYCLEVGADQLGELGNLTDAEITVRLKELWGVYGAEVMADWPKKHPGSRPECWWMFSAPEPRPQIVWRAASDAYAADRALRRAQDVAVLFRHGLLTKEEMRLLAGEDAPERCA